MLSIGSLTLPLPCMVAPMAGVSDLAFRLITRRFGAPLCFTEMIDARALSHKDKRTRFMLSSNSEDRPLGIQLIANDENYIVKALEMLEAYEFDLLDFNAACPAPKVTRKGMGAALLKDLPKLRGLLRVIVDNARHPVTLKIRSGWDPGSVNARAVALAAEDSGVEAVIIHGRTKTQGYSGTVDYGIIRDVKEALKIPVIASGDNLSLLSVRKMFDETGCDGVAIARGSLGNPFIFRELRGLFRGEAPCSAPDADEIVGVMKDHLALTILYQGEKRGVSFFRKFFIWYTRGLRGVKPLRDKAFRAETTYELLDVIEEIRLLESGRPV